MSDQWTDRLSEYLDGDLTEAERARARGAPRATARECAGDAGRPAPDRHAGALPRGPAARARPLGRRRGTDRRAGPDRSGSTPAADRLLRAPAPRRGDRARRALGWRRVAAAPRLPPSRVAVRADPGRRATCQSARCASAPRRSYDAAVDDLERVLAQGRGRLDSATVRVLEQNLAIIDRAIAQAQSRGGGRLRQSVPQFPSGRDHAAQDRPAPAGGDAGLRRELKGPRRASATRPAPADRLDRSGGTGTAARGQRLRRRDRGEDLEPERRAGRRPTPAAAPTVEIDRSATVVTVRTQGRRGPPSDGGPPDHRARLDGARPLRGQYRHERGRRARSHLGRDGAGRSEREGRRRPGVAAVGAGKREPPGRQGDASRCTR